MRLSSGDDLPGNHSVEACDIRDYVAAAGDGAVGVTTLLAVAGCDIVTVLAPTAVMVAPMGCRLR